MRTLSIIDPPWSSADSDPPLHAIKKPHAAAHGGADHKSALAHDVTMGYADALNHRPSMDIGGF